MSQTDKNLMLTWTNYDQKLTSAFRRFLDAELFCNVTLSAEGKSIKCHQEILSACSNWFEKTLAPVEYDQHPIIILRDVNYKELEYLIRFMYSGEAIVPQEDIQTFLKTAEMLEIKGLLESSESNDLRTRSVKKEEELTVTAKKSDTSPFDPYNLVMYNHLNMNNPTKIAKTNPLMRAYEANKRKTSESTSTTSAIQPVHRKSSRNYEANAPVYDNRHLYPVDLVQPHPDYSDDYDGDIADDPPPASGIEDCGPYKKVWSYRYLCYNLGKEILCLLCFCRFTQFKKFNLDRHMRNKHAHLYYIDDETKRKMLDIYVSRYEENVTPGMIASVPSQGNEQMAATILQVNSNQVESLMGEAEPLPMHPMMEGDELLECQLGEEEPGDISVKKETIQI